LNPTVFQRCDLLTHAVLYLDKPFLGFSWGEFQGTFRLQNGTGTVPKLAGEDARDTFAARQR
jgi:hypothetical protein